jgi:hypothetical protein
VLLVGLGGKKSLKQPLAVVDLDNLSNFFEGGDAPAHNFSFPRAIMDLFNGNRGCTSCVNDAFVVSDRGECTSIVEYAPILFNQGRELAALLGR